MILHEVDRKSFDEISPRIHAAVFHETRDLTENRYNYAIVVADENKMIAYTTIIEMDNQTAYMQHGGATPETKGTVLSKRAYRKIVDHLKSRYKRISTRIQNTNTAMIKFALSEGLIIDGCFAYGAGEVYLSLGWGF